MKKLLSIFASFVLTTNTFAQAPQKMTYQAVVRNSSNILVQNSTIGIKVSLLQGSASGPAVYVETHSTVTNDNGLLNIEIGGGTVVSGIYVDGIFWGGDSYFLKTEIDPLGGTNYTTSAISELLSVPYSNYSHVSGSLAGFATNFVGVYKEVIQTLVNGYVFISYMGADKVQLSFNTLDSPSLTVNFYGTVLGNTITFPSGNFDTLTGDGIKSGNSLIINFPGLPTLDLIKQ